MRPTAPGASPCGTDVPWLMNCRRAHLADLRMLSVAPACSLRGITIAPPLAYFTSSPAYPACGVSCLISESVFASSRRNASLVHAPMVSDMALPCPAGAWICITLHPVPLPITSSAFTA